MYLPNLLVTMYNNLLSINSIGASNFQYFMFSIHDFELVLLIFNLNQVCTSLFSIYQWRF